MSAETTTSVHAVHVPATLEEFMLHALAMERDAIERYTDFADQMETHNNGEVAAMFRTMAGYETKHAQEIMDQMGWKEPPVLALQGVRWAGFDSPEAPSIDSVHYLMQPWHALELALACEERALRFFGALAKAVKVPAVKRVAREMEEEEREHVALVKAWMAKVPRPAADWATDPDPPRYLD